MAERAKTCPVRTAAVINAKRSHTWFYETVLRVEAKIGAAVAENQLHIEWASEHISDTR